MAESVFNNDINYLLLLALILGVIGFIVRAFVKKAAVEGLVLYTAATFILLITSYALIDKTNIGKSAVQVVGEIFFGAGLPILVFIALVGWTLKIVIDRKNLLYKDQVPPQFKDFLNITTTTFFIQILLMYNYVSTLISSNPVVEDNPDKLDQSDQFKRLKFAISSQMTSIIMLTTVINFIIVSVLSVINRFYFTDG